MIIMITKFICDSSSETVIIDKGIKPINIDKKKNREFTIELTF